MQGKKEQRAAKFAEKKAAGANTSFLNDDEEQVNGDGEGGQKQPAEAAAAAGATTEAKVSSKKGEGNEVENRSHTHDSCQGKLCVEIMCVWFV